MELMLGRMVQKSSAGFEKRVRCCVAGDEDVRYVLAGGSYINVNLINPSLLRHAWEVTDDSGDWKPIQAGIAAKLSQG